MAVSKIYEEPKERGAAADCGVRLAPLYVTHTVLLVVGVIWLIAILSG